MTMLRRYVFAFVAVCAAFAAGIALGNGPLQGDHGATDTAALTHDNTALRQRIANARAAEAFPRAMAALSSPTVLHGLLTSQSVGVVVLPGVPAAAVTSAVDSAKTAGAEVVWTIHLGAAVVDPTRKTYVESVATNTAKGLTDLGVPADAAPYTRLGALLARAYTGPGDSLAVDVEATQIDAQLRGAKVVAISPALSRRAGGVIVLAPGDHGNADSVYALHQIESQLVVELATRADGLVLATPAGGAAPGGLLSTKALGSGRDAIATFDLVGTSSGAVGTIGALASVLTGRPGAFGVVAGKAVVPPALDASS